MRKLYFFKKIILNIILGSFFIFLVQIVITPFLTLLIGNIIIPKHTNHNFTIGFLWILLGGFGVPIASFLIGLFLSSQKLYIKIIKIKIGILTICISFIIYILFNIKIDSLLITSFFNLFLPVQFILFLISILLMYLGIKIGENLDIFRKPFRVYWYKSKFGKINDQSPNFHK